MQKFDQAMISAKYAIHRVPQGRIFLLQNLNEINNSDKQVNEFWILRGNEHDGEEELYVQDNRIVLTTLSESTKYPTPKILLTMKSSILAACFATFELPHDLRFSNLSTKCQSSTLQHGIAIFEKDIWTFFSDQGDELTAKLPCPVYSVWPLEKGLLFEGNCQSGLSLYAITHPLDEISPIYFRVKDENGQWKSLLCLDGHLRIIDTNHNPPIVSMINTITGKHSLWLLRDADPIEYQCLFTIFNGEFVLSPAVYNNCCELGCAQQVVASGIHTNKFLTHYSHSGAGDMLMTSTTANDMPSYAGPFLQHSRINQLLSDDRTRFSFPLSNLRSTTDNCTTFCAPLPSSIATATTATNTATSPFTPCHNNNHHEHSIAVNPFADTLQRLKSASRHSVTQCSDKSQLPTTTTANPDPMEILKAVTQAPTSNKYQTAATYPEGEPLHPTLCLQLIWSEENLPLPIVHHHHHHLHHELPKQNVSQLTKPMEAEMDEFSHSHAIHNLSLGFKSPMPRKSLGTVGNMSWSALDSMSMKPILHKLTTLHSTPLRSNYQQQQETQPTFPSSFHIKGDETCRLDKKFKPPTMFTGPVTRRGFIAQEICQQNVQRLWAAYLKNSMEIAGGGGGGTITTTESKCLMFHLLECNKVNENVTYTCSRTHCMPVKDAVYLNDLHMILVLDTHDHLVLYSGIKKICNLGVTPPPLDYKKKPLPSSILSSLPLSVVQFVQSSSTLTASPASNKNKNLKKRPNALVKKPPPIVTEDLAFKRPSLQQQQQQQQTCGKMIYELSESSGTGFTLKICDPNKPADCQFVRFYLSELSTNPLVKRCVDTLRLLLPNEVCHEFIIRWYTENNAPGKRAHRTQEWQVFVHLLFNTIGIQQENPEDCQSSSHTTTTSTAGASTTSMQDSRPSKRHCLPSQNEILTNSNFNEKINYWQMCSQLLKSPLQWMNCSLTTSSDPLSSCIASGFLRPGAIQEYPLVDNQIDELLRYRERHAVNACATTTTTTISAMQSNANFNDDLNLGIVEKLVWKVESVTTPLKDFIPEILIVFHLIYEDIKLDRTFVQNRRLLAQLNLTLSVVLGWQGYVDYYLREHPLLLPWFEKCLQLRNGPNFKLTHTEPVFPLWSNFDPMRPPLVSAIVCQLLQMTTVPQTESQSESKVNNSQQQQNGNIIKPFPILPNYFTDNIHLLLRCIVLLKRFTLPNLPVDYNISNYLFYSTTTSSSDSEKEDRKQAEKNEEKEYAFNELQSDNVYEAFVAYLSQLSQDSHSHRRRWFTNLPPGIKLLLSMALTYCKEDPPPNCSLALYRLLDRNDFIRQMELHDEENQNSLVIVDHWHERVQPFMPMPLVVEKLRQNDYTLNPTLIMQLEADVAVQFAFRFDLRLREAGRLLICPAHHTLQLNVQSGIDGQSISQVNDEANWTLLAHAFRASSMPVGRGMLLLTSHQGTHSPGLSLSTLSHGNQLGGLNASLTRPSNVHLSTANTPATAAYLTDSLATPPHLVPMHVSIYGYVNNAASALGMGTRYALSTADQTHVLRRYPAYHMGVTEALRFASHIELNTSWLFNDRPEADSIQEAERAGMILGLGLVGHLDSLSLFNISQYLTRKYDMSNMAILLSLCSRKRRSGDNTLMRILAVHFRPMLPAASVELEPLNLCHSAAMLGLGMLYESTGSLHIGQIMLNEIASPVCVEDEEGRVSVSREALGLAAGFSLGLIMFQKANDKCIVNVLGNQISLMQQLHALMTGAQRLIPRTCDILSSEQSVVLEDVPDVVGANLHFYLSVGGEATPVMGGYEGLDRGYVGGGVGVGGSGAAVSGLDTSYGDVAVSGVSGGHQHYRRRFLYGDARIGREGRSRRYHAKIMEGDRYNVDVSSSGAIVALGLAFFDAISRKISGANVVQSWLSCPTNGAQLSYVRPHHLRLRAISHGLVCWSQVTPNDDWLLALIPCFLRRFAPPGSFNNHQEGDKTSSSAQPPPPDIQADLDSLSLAEQDDEGLKSSCLHFISGCLFVVALKYAGTHDMKAYKFLMRWCKQLLLHPSLQVNATNTNNGTTAHHPPRVFGLSLCKWNEAISLALLSISMVMSGSGNIKILRLLRIFRSRLFFQLVRSIRKRRSRLPTLPGGLPPPSQPLNIASSWLHEAHFGAFQFVHMAVGLLFLGGGRLTLSNRPEDIPMLLISFFPEFSHHGDDQVFYLQALRNLYVLATRPGRLTAVDCDTHQPVDSQLVLVPKPQMSVEDISWRNVLPNASAADLERVAWVELRANNYWTMKFRPGSKEWKLLQDSFYKGGYIYMKRRQQCNTVQTIFLDAQHLLGQWLQPFVAEQLGMFVCGVKNCFLYDDGDARTNFIIPTVEGQTLSTFMNSRFSTYKIELLHLLRRYVANDVTANSPLLTAFLYWYYIFYRQDVQNCGPLVQLINGTVTQRRDFLLSCDAQECESRLSMTTLFSIYLHLSNNNAHHAQHTL